MSLVGLACWEISMLNLIFWSWSWIKFNIKFFYNQSLYPTLEIYPKSNLRKKFLFSRQYIGTIIMVYNDSSYYYKHVYMSISIIVKINTPLLKISKRNQVI